jgi:hypothetical protein
LDLLTVIKPAPFQLQFHFWKQEEVTGCQIRGVRWVGNDSDLLFRQKLLGEDGSVRRGVVVKQPGLFSQKFGATSSHVFTQLPQNFAVEPGIHSLACWDRCFALPQLLYRWRHQSGIFWIPTRMLAFRQTSLIFSGEHSSLTTGKETFLYVSIRGSVKKFREFVH